MLALSSSTGHRIGNTAPRARGTKTETTKFETKKMFYSPTDLKRLKRENQEADGGRRRQSMREKAIKRKILTHNSKSR